MNSAYNSYWGKARSAGSTMPTCHLLAYHCLDVAAVGRVFLQSQPGLLKRFERLSGIGESFLQWSEFLLAIHDVGKFADGFQNQEPDLLNQFQRQIPTTPFHERHDILGYRLCKKYIATVFNSDCNQDDLWDLLEPWISAVTGHHGRPPQPDIFPPPVELQFPDQVCKDALAFIRDIIDMFLPDGLPFQTDSFDYHLQTFKHFSWQMAGLTVLADWIGSNEERWFPYHDDPMPLTEYWQQIALPQAKIAVQESDMTPAKAAVATNIRVLFPIISSPTPLQKLVEEMDITSGPQLFIIEEVTGGGKTEAALTLAHRLMSNGSADGLFMALPTMATANAMHGRVHEMYRKLFDQDSKPSMILAHSTSQIALGLERQKYKDISYRKNENSASQDCADWLADNRKKALLAHVGVGTIDQALLSILPVRHQSLRLFGLTRKVLIVDEVHACDAYMHQLLCTLLRFHAAQGGSAILLSASLPRSMRAELLKHFAKGEGAFEPEINNNAYPLLTYFSEKSIMELPVEARAEASRRVEVRPIYDMDEVDSLLQSTLDNGGCACWVRNTVHDALQSYHEWAEKLGKDRVILFHARFALGDRLKIEKEVGRCFGVKSKEIDRHGKLLIATQVVEQSLDLDFDFMVTDLAPIDLIIQRAGRLQRHERGPRTPVLGIYMPQPATDADKDWYISMFPKGAWVYPHHGQLWLTASWLAERKGFSMPEEAREMIEFVYGAQSEDAVPDPLTHVETKALGEDSAKSSLGHFNSLQLDEGYMATMTHWQDDDSAPTRLGEPTITVRLARYVDERLEPWYRGNTGHDWELSQLTIQKFRVASEDPDNMPVAVSAAKKKMPGEGRYCVVIPMEPSAGKWTGQAMNDKDKIVKLYYDEFTGLEVKEE